MGIYVILQFCGKSWSENDQSVSKIDDESRIESFRVFVFQAELRLNKERLIGTQNLSIAAERLPRLRDR